MKYIYNKDANAFLSEDGNELEITNIKYVNLAIKAKDKDTVSSSEVLGLWTTDLLSNAAIYYTIINGQVTELIAYKVYGKTKYVFNMDWQIIECIPEENDIVFSDYNEARIAILSIADKIEAAVSYEVQS